MVTDLSLLRMCKTALFSLKVMRMRTIRWCNGQCPGRNGQWAERIAHAGSGAVRLVPFSAAAVFPRILRLSVRNRSGQCRKRSLRDWLFQSRVVLFR